MRIGINALYLIPGGVGGTEIYLRSLLAALAGIDQRNEYRVFANEETGRDLTPEAANFQHVTLPVRAVNRPGRILFEQFRMPAADVLLNAGFTAPLLGRTPMVTVIHDLQHKRHPEHFKRVDLPAWQFLVWGAVRRSERLIAVSEATRADIARFYPGAERKTRVAPHGVDARMFEVARRRAPEPVVLCVSTLHPHKNIERLVRVFGRLRERRPEYRLVLAGMKGFQAGAVERAIGELGLEGAVTVTGWIPREELYEWYARAAAFVYPSTFEGFGMPVLEALAAGIPTACSAIEPLRSIAGGAARLFDPGDEAGMLRAIEDTLDSPAAGGPEVAAGYTWERAARITLEELEAARGGRG